MRTPVRYMGLGRSEVQAVAGAGVEPGDGAEPVAADQSCAPLQGAARRAAETFDGEGRDVRGKVEQPSFGGGGNDGLDAFLSAGEAEAAAAGGFVVERGGAEVSRQQPAGAPRQQPHPL